MCDAFLTALQCSVSSSSLITSLGLLFVKTFFFFFWDESLFFFFPELSSGVYARTSNALQLFYFSHSVEFISIFIMCSLFICRILWSLYDDNSRSASAHRWLLFKQIWRNNFYWLKNKNLDVVQNLIQFEKLHKKQTSNYAKCMVTPVKRLWAVLHPSTSSAYPLQFSCACLNWHLSSVHFLIRKHFSRIPGSTYNSVLEKADAFYLMRFESNKWQCSNNMKCCVGM